MPFKDKTKKTRNAIGKFLFHTVYYNNQPLFSKIPVFHNIVGIANKDQFIRGPRFTRYIAQPSRRNFCPLRDTNHIEMIKKAIHFQIKKNVSEDCATALYKKIVADLDKAIKITKKERLTFINAQKEPEETNSPNKPVSTPSTQAQSEATFG